MIGLPGGRSCGRPFLTFWPEIRDATASSMKKMELLRQVGGSGGHATVE